VELAAGHHARMPRSYRGRDAFAWLDALGQLDLRADQVRDLAAARRAPGFPVSGRGGGESLGLDRLVRLGVAVHGRLAGFSGRHAIFAGDLERHVYDADRRLYRGLAKIDEHIERTGVPAGPRDAPPPVRLPSEPGSLDLRDGISTVVWATGFRRAYPWLRVPVVDARGELVHRGGVTPEAGLFALGLRFQRTRKSHLIGGVGEDAAAIARAITAGDRLALAA
jgi:putative flavoprotein involved in K+ transport